MVERAGSSLQAIRFGLLELGAAGKSVDARLLAIGDAVREIVATHGVRRAAMETLFFSRNISTALQVCEARGAIRFVLATLGIPLGEHSPQAVKMAVAGNGHAAKEQIGRMVKMLYGLREIPKPDDVADALAVAWTEATASRTNALIRAATS